MLMEPKSRQQRLLHPIEHVNTVLSVNHSDIKCSFLGSRIILQYKWLMEGNKTSPVHYLVTKGNKDQQGGLQGLPCHL